MAIRTLYLTPSLTVMNAAVLSERKKRILDVATWRLIVEKLRAVGMSDDDIKDRIRFATTGSLKGELPKEVVDASEIIFRTP